MKKINKWKIAGLLVVGLLFLMLLMPICLAAINWGDNGTVQNMVDLEDDGSLYISIDMNNDDVDDQLFGIFKNGDFSTGTELFRVQEDGKVGIATTGPDAKLDVLDTSGPQLRLTHTDGSTYADFESASDGVLHIDTVHGKIEIGSILTTNTRLVIEGGSGTYDATLVLDVQNNNWHIGVDDSDDDKLKIGLGSAVGALTYMTIDRLSGDISVTGDISATDISATDMSASGIIKGDDIETGGNGAMWRKTQKYTKGSVNNYRIDFDSDDDSASNDNYFMISVHEEKNDDEGVGGNYAELMRVEEEGNVGIATPSPTEKLDVNGKVRVRNLPASNPNDEIVVANSTGVLHNSGKTIGYLIDHDWYEVSTTDPPDDIDDNIFTHGKVGIGAEDPGAKLEIKQTVLGSTMELIDFKVDSHTFTAMASLTNQRFSQFKQSTINTMPYSISNAATVYIEGAPIDTHSSITANSALWIDDGVARFDDKVGIGDPVPDALLDIASTLDTDMFRVDDNGDADITPFVIDKDGQVGIGIINPLTSLHINGDVAFGAGNELTISSGSVTVTHSYHTIEVESGVTDDLTTINGGDVAGQILIIRAAHDDHDIVVKDGAIILSGNSDFTLDDLDDTLVIFYDGSNWLELSRSNNS